MRRLVLLVVAVLMLGLGLSTADSEAAAPRSAMVTFVQAVPDVVLHLAAEAGGDPIVHSYRAPTGATRTSPW